ncbi:Cytochrome P450 monooxygenase astJ [Madurella fahalii]|uniref:Cytochrome P450 monooxygenase astJ n=1 Tax=Madurella fahalii TaxID=1157608 RepID=A0ABQ0GQI5_9PEZI
MQARFPIGFQHRALDKMDALLTGLYTPTSVALTCLLGLVVVYPLLRSIYRIQFDALSGIPGKRTWSASRLPFIWSLVRGTLVQDLEEMHRQYGPVLRVAPDEVSFAHPDAWSDILQPRAGGNPPFLKHPTWWTPMPGTPPGLVTAIDPKLHAAIRKRLSPAFTSTALKSHEPVLHQYVDLLIERLRQTLASGDEDGDEIDVVRWFNYLTFDVFGDLAFAESFECLQRSQYHRWIALIFENLKYNGALISSRFYPVVDWILAKTIPPSLRKAQKDHFQQIVEKVRHRLDHHHETRRSDFMSYLTSSRGPVDVNDQLGLDIINASFSELAIAGSETTAMALSAALNLLIHNTDKRDILVNEIRQRFRTYDEITADALRGLVYLNAVLNEVLRLCPPVPWMPPRQVPEGGSTVCGRWLPGGTAVSITFTSMHREPNSFHAASEFHPERWLPMATTDKDSPFFHDRRQAVQPFSVGPRSCIGQNLAWAEMRLALAKVLWTFDVAAPADKSKWVSWGSLKTFLLIEKKPIKVVMKLRTL